MDVRTLLELDYGKVREDVSSFCVSEEGKTAFLLREPSSDTARIEYLKSLGREWTVFLSAKKNDALHLWNPILPAVKSLSVSGSVLSESAIFDLGIFCRCVKTVRAAVLSADSELGLKNLSALVQTFPFAEISDAENRIFRIINSDGEMRDLPSLQELRAKIHALNANIKRILKSFTSDSRYSSVLESAVPVFRSERQLLAVKSAHRRAIKGIVHEVSQSGMTVFIEPEDAVRCSNELVQAEYELNAEIRRILSVLCEEIRPFCAVFTESLALMQELDCTLAAAKWGLTHGAVFAENAREEPLLLLSARHPLLGEAAVPVDVRFMDGRRILIISGPNAGGKTAHRIFKADGTGAELTLQNIKLQGGIAEGASESGFGGALYVKGGAALVLDKCVVTDNSAWRGGGIYIAEDSKFEAKNGCKILQNKAVYDTSMSYSGLGGGVSTSKSGEIELSNAELNDNTAEQSGGAICIYGAKSFKIENCTIKQNKAKHYGAGVFCDDNYAPITAEITNSAIENNELDQNLEQDSSGTYGGAGISFTGIGTGRTLTISGGSIKNNKAYKLYGGGIRAGIATVTIKDNVNISGNTAEKGGGVYSIISGTFNMESGTISGNKAVTGGGVFLSGTFNMSGGIISGNEAKKSDTEYGDGGGVYIDGTSGQLNMKGGSLIQPSADKLAGKNDVYIGENKFIQLTGALTNSSNVVANLTSGSYDSDKTLVKWSGAGDMEGYKARFALTENGRTWSLILSTDKKSLILKPKNETKLIDGSKGGTWAQLKNAVEGADANAEILVKGTIKALSSDSEIEVSKPVTIKPKGANAVLDADNRCRIFKITGSGKLTLQKDSSNKITLTKGNADKGGAVLVETCRVFTAHNVTVKDCKATGSGGGAVYVENAGEFTAYDLNISGCEADGSGGAIFTENNTTVTVSNGKLSSCTAGGNGGAIVNGGALNISSITFESNEAKGSNSYGGAIYSDGTSSVTASGCTFGGTEGNKAQNGGAAAIVGNSENAVVFTSCIFQKNTAEGSHGGAIFAERAITVKGTSSNKTKILSNKIGGASGKGGGIYSSAKLDIEYAEISGNTVTGGSGGGIYSTGILNIINSTIGGTGADSGNTANDNGGGIYADAKSVCTIKDSDIVGNTANGMGGGLFVSSDGTEKGKCTITGGTFKKNGATGSGGGAIYCFGVLVIKDCTIGGTGVGDGNTASGVDGGGGIFIYNGSCTLTSTIVTGNAVSGTTAKGAGVFLYSSYNNPIFTVGGTTKIGSVTDTNAVYVGYALSFQAVVTADNLKDGAYINLEPANYPNQKNRELVKGANTSSYASSYKDYFHLTGITTGETWRLQPNAGNNALVLQEIIDGGDGSSSGAWKKLKDAVSVARENDVILVKGTIKATSDDGNNGEILVKNKKITIKKEGTADVVIDANTKSRIFKVTGAGAELTLKDLTLKGGKAKGSGDADNGGGIFFDGGSGVFSNCTIESCSSNNFGGAIALKKSAILEIKDNSHIKSCNAKNKGGGLYIVDGAAVSLINSYVEGCHVTSNTSLGGGVWLESSISASASSALDLSENSSITLCTAGAHGGAVYMNSNTTLTMEDKAKVTVSTENTDGKNEIYFQGGEIKVKETLSAGDEQAARITVYNPSDGKQVLTGDTAANCTKFAVTPNGTQEWEIDTDGKLAKKRKTIKNSDTNAWEQLKNAVSAAADGDVIIIDGEIKATTDTNNSGEIEITKKLTIQGKAEALSDSLDANSKNRIFKVTGAGELTLQNLTLKGGNSGTDNGGIIYVDSGTKVTLSGCSIKSGSANQGGAFYVKGTLDIKDSSTISSCEATSNGGGIYIEGASAKCNLIGSKIIGCKTTGPTSWGGGVYMDNGAFTMEGNAEITSCSANNENYGGGVYVAGTNCTFEMKDNAKVTVSTENTDGKNEIYLQDGKIKLTGKLSAGNGEAGRISVMSSNYQTSTQVLTGDNLTVNCKKFTVTPNGSVNWYVGSNGKLTQTQP